MKVFAWLCDETLLLENTVRFVGSRRAQPSTHARLVGRVRAVRRRRHPLVWLCLQAEEKFYAPLLLFGEELRDGDVQEGEIQLQIGASPPPPPFALRSID